MKTELLYSQTLYVPLNIRYPDLFSDCDNNNITYDKTNITRVYTFYHKKQSKIRYIRTKYILKPL